MIGEDANHSLTCTDPVMDLNVEIAYPATAVYREAQYQMQQINLT